MNISNLMFAHQVQYIYTINIHKSQASILLQIFFLLQCSFNVDVKSPLVECSLHLKMFEHPHISLFLPLRSEEPQGGADIPMALAFPQIYWRISGFKDIFLLKYIGECIVVEKYETSISEMRSRPGACQMFYTLEKLS